MTLRRYRRRYQRAFRRDTVPARFGADFSVAKPLLRIRQVRRLGRRNCRRAFPRLRPGNRHLRLDCKPCGLRSWLEQCACIGHGDERSRRGVCRDLAHLGISLCRSLSIPARLVVGYLCGLVPMDIHAWFEAYVGGRWYTFDPTQKGPKGGRLAVAYGKDAADVAVFQPVRPRSHPRFHGRWRRRAKWPAE